MNPSPSSPRPGALQRLGAALIGIVLALSAFVLMVGALLIGLAAAAGLTLWSLLRGGKPGPASFGWPPSRFGGTGRRGGPPRSASEGEIVDVQAREVPEVRDKRD